MSDLPSAPAGPMRLYALQLKLRPLEKGTLMPFSGELIHAAWLEWIRAASPDISAMLHEGNKRRLFTCSSLQFPLTRGRMVEAERENTHLPVLPDKTYTVRITLLLTELFSLFYNILMHVNSTAPGATKPPFMRIGKREFLLEEVICTPDDTTSWTGFTSFADLVERARTWQTASQPTLTLEFASLTAFNWLHVADKTYGNHYARLPLPGYIFPTLARRWHELAPPELAHCIQIECIERYITADGVIIDNYELKAHSVQFVRNPQRGFLGTCTYQLRSPDQPATTDAPLTLHQQIYLLTMLAFYSGIGYKTTMGMGQVRLLPGKHK